MQIDYFLQTIVNGSLEIENVKNCAIEANDDMGNYYYLIIKTNMGISNVLEYGPVNKYEISGTAYQKFKRAEINDIKLKKIVSDFLNNELRKITQAKEVPFEVAYENYPSLLEYLKKDFDESEGLDA